MYKMTYDGVTVTVKMGRSKRTRRLPMLSGDANGMARM